MFEPCEICGARDWDVARKGAVRDGAFGRLTSDEAVVGRCRGCRVERLAEAFCYDDSLYTGTDYRALLQEQTSAEGFFAEHDGLQLQKLTVLWPEPARGKRIADIGCGAGSFLDHVSGLARTTVAVEPCEAYHDFLRDRGHAVHASTAEAKDALAGGIDLAVSFRVIEHVGDPRAFLEDIGRMLAPDGRLLVTTPNRADILMDLLPDDYPAFFYRTVHRWYFDIPSFTDCAARAGLEVERSIVQHRFGLSNALRWLRDRRPGGSAALPHLDSALMDRVWQSYLEQSGRGDYLYFWLRRAA